MDKRTIPTCVADNKLNALIEEAAACKTNNNFEIQCLSKDIFFKNKSSFVMVDESIFFEIIEEKIPFKQIILIRTSVGHIKVFPKNVEIIAIDTPFRFRDLYEVISNRLELINSQNERIIKFNSFTYDPRTRALTNKNISIRFTEKESHIFEYLLNNSNVYVSKKILLKDIWSYSEDIDTHTLETHIYSLRKKISKNLTLKQLINFEEKKGYFLNKEIL